MSLSKEEGRMKGQDMCASLCPAFIYTYFLQLHGNRVPPTPANRLQIYRIATCVLHHLFRECFVPTFPTLGEGEENYI